MKKKHRLQFVYAYHALSWQTSNLIFAILLVDSWKVVAACLVISTKPDADVVFSYKISCPGVIDVREAIDIVSRCFIEPLYFESPPRSVIAIAVGFARIFHFLNSTKAVERFLEHPESCLAVNACLAIIEQISEYSGIHLESYPTEGLVYVEPLERELGKPV